MEKLTEICLVLGSNLSNRKQNLETAILELTKQLELQNVKRSDFLENKALLKPDSPPEWNKDYLNIAIAGKLSLEKFDPEAILKIIHQIEEDLGRKRNGKNWQPREIDIDIACLSNHVIEDEQLTIPHQDLLDRDFFLTPMQQIIPDWQYPVQNSYFKLTIAEIIEKNSK